MLRCFDENEEEKRMIDLGPYLFIVVAIVSSGVRLSTSIFLPAIGETFSQRSGVLNVGLEGMMTMGSFAAIFVTFYTGNPVLGLLAGVIAGALIASIMAVVSISVRMNQVVAGIAIWLFGWGLADYLYRALLKMDTKVEGFGPLPIPYLSQIPILGDIFFNHSIIVYVSFIVLPISWFVLYKTSFGLKVRAVGENPRAADVAGINVYHIRYICTILAGVAAGFGGAAILLEETHRYFEGMMMGRGFLSLAIVMFGTWTPHRVWAAALIIGTSLSIVLNLQVLGTYKGPIDFISMIPYALTIIVLAVTGRSKAMPAGLTIPYSREE
jgi:ABC-type uncharacterized transport system permease subunit